MRIPATAIEQWASSRDAQALLPVLVRRLIAASGKLRSMNLPGGEQISRPGWDGVVDAESGNAWLPVGRSYWEMGCAEDALRKATDDYAKRSKIPVEQRRDGAFIFVSPRNRPGKERWLADRAGVNDWRDVRVYDASDLEQWLEHTPAVAVWFAEQIGLSGPGVESADQYWDRWSKQSEPHISLEAILAGRSKQNEKLRQAIQSGARIVTIRADSVEEAAAFATASILTEDRENGIHGKTLVVSDPNGWRYIVANPDACIAIAARPEVATQNPQLGLTIILPLALGDRGSHFQGLAAREGDEGTIVLERPLPDQFEAALTGMGFDRAETQRMLRATSRSWSVFRRIRATNAGIANPPWMQGTEVPALVTLCLLGAWSSTKEGDRRAVEAISSRAYSDVDRDLHALACRDDAPLIQIGAVWKAKSPLELLHLVGPRITRLDLSRFLQVAEGVLSTPDPQLELPDDQRHAAAIYGKIREESGLVIDSLCDALMKLAVRGPDNSTLASLAISTRVAQIVRSLLRGADRTRWLSLSGVLSELAEAAPSEFLGAIEDSLDKPDCPIAALFDETTQSTFGRCWYADLLWALEVLAWSPTHLSRVAVLLTRMGRFEIKANWSNKPTKSLVGILRSWMPQTAAPISQRIKTLEVISGADPDVAWIVLEGLGPSGHDVGHFNPRPRWRADDEGATDNVPRGETVEMLQAVVDRQLNLADGHASRVADLLKRLDHLTDTDRERILELACKFAEPTSSDADRNIVRNALREHIHWHRNFDRNDATEVARRLAPVAALYDALAPTDPVARHQWLFEESWLRLPEWNGGDFGQGRAEDLRREALSEIINAVGYEGVDRLVGQIASPYVLGWTLADITADDAALDNWITSDASQFSPGSKKYNCVAGYFSRLTGERRSARQDATIQRAKIRGCEPRSLVNLLLSFPCERQTWEAVERQTAAEQLEYWSKVRCRFFRGDANDQRYLLEHLLAANRPRTAFEAAEFSFGSVPPALLIQILNRIVAGDESGAPLPDAYQISEALKVLTQAGSVPRSDLARVEFAFANALKYNEHGTPNLVAELLVNPQLLCDLVCMLYRPASGGRGEQADDRAQTAAHLAFQVIHDFASLPGLKPDGSIDPASFRHWIDEARLLLSAADRAVVGDHVLGGAMAHAPAGLDGIWPCEAVRDLLNETGSSELRRGFTIGARNKRGVTVRNPYDGGGQERTLASDYRRHAVGLQITHPLTAEAVETIAQAFEEEAQHHDLDAQLRIEGA